jgi:hypothetical protein
MFSIFHEDIWQKTRNRPTITAQSTDSKQTRWSEGTIYNEEHRGRDTTVTEKHTRTQPGK